MQFSPLLFRTYAYIKGYVKIYFKQLNLLVFLNFFRYSSQQNMQPFLMVEINWNVCFDSYTTDAQGVDKISSLSICETAFMVDCEKR